MEENNYEIEEDFEVVEDYTPDNDQLDFFFS